MINCVDMELGVTSSETDTLVQTNSNNWNTLAGQLGVNYVHYFKYSPTNPNVQWFPAISPQLNVYQLSSNSINLSLGSNTRSSFVWEAGAGLMLALNQHFGVSFEYLYANLGTVKTSASGNTGTISTPVISAPSFNVRAQTALLGLHLAV